MAGTEIHARLKSSWVTWEARLDIGLTHEIAGNRTASWEFVPPFGTLDFVRIFYDPITPDNPVQRIFDVHLVETASETEIATLRTPVVPADFRAGRATFDFNDIDVSGHPKLRLDIALPKNAPSEGVALHYQTDPRSNGMVGFGSKKLSQTDFSLQVFAPTRPFPSLLVGAGFLFLGAATYCRNNLTRRESVLIESMVATAIVTLIAGYFQDLRVEGFHVHYWPDHYPAMAYDWFRLLGGELSWREFHASLIEERNGQVFIVPLILGVLQFFGAGPSTAFQILISLFTGATILLVANALSDATPSRLASFLGMLAVTSSPFILRAAGYFQTDAAGMFFSLGSVMLIGRLATIAKPSWPLVAATSGLIVLSILTRLSNLPLLLLPACVGICLLAAKRSPESRFSPAVLVATTLTALGGLLVVWYGLDLFQSIEKSLEFSRLPEFRSGFSLGVFAKITLFAAWPAILAASCGFGHLLRTPRLLAMGGAICGLLLLLLIGKIVPWYRYWIPIHVLSLVFGIFYLERFASKRLVPALFAGLVIAVNLWVVFAESGLR